MDNIIIRKVDEGYVDSFYQIYSRAYLGKDIEIYAYNTKHSIKGYFWWLLKRDRDGLMVAEFENLPIGFVACDTNWFSKYEDQYVAEIHEIIVDPSFQGRGIGKKLMEAALKYGKSRNRKISELWVGITNEKAKKFYKKLGYVEREVHSMWLRMVRQI